MALIGLIADTHSGIKNDNPILLENMKLSTSFFFQELDKRGIEDIVHLGDLFDRRKYINFNTANVCRKHFLEPASKYRTHIIMGNHDQYWKDRHEVNALRELVDGRYPNISVYQQAIDITVAGLKVLMMPWITDTNRAHALDTIKKSNARVVMGHLELAGFERYRNVIKEDGDDASIYSKFEAVYTGHFHQKSSQKNVHYIGAMGEYTWSDYDCPRGFSILNTDTLDLEFVQNPYKVFKQLHYDDTKDMSTIDYSEYTDAYVKLVVVNRTNPFLFDQVFDKLHDARPADVGVVEDIDSFVDTNPDEVVDEAQDTPTILDTYISSLTLPVDATRMQGYMRDLYKEAISMEHVNE
jgi:predicted phosphodiesterase